MKKYLALILTILMVLSLCSCSSGSMSKAEYSFDSAYPTESPEYISDEYYEEAGAAAFDSSESVNVKENAAQTGRKLIRTVNLSVQTLEFDNFIKNISDMVIKEGGYVESSSVSGNGYNYNSSRYADFTLRIPSKKLDDFINTVNGMANITYKNENQEDITLTYVDTESRIKTLNTEYERLLELLEEAKDIDTIIALESRLSDVRYQLESYNSQLRTYDNKVDYSTVYLDVAEVERITETESETVWERIQNEFGNNVYDVWIGLQDFFVWFVTSLPYFAVIIVVIIIFVLIIKLILNLFPGYREKKKERKLKKEERKAQKKLEKEMKAANKVAPTDMKDDQTFFENVPSEVPAETKENTEKTE